MHVLARLPFKRLLYVTMYLCIVTFDALLRYAGGNEVFFKRSWSRELDIILEIQLLLALYIFVFKQVRIKLKFSLQRPFPGLVTHSCSFKQHLSNIAKHVTFVEIGFPAFNTKIKKEWNENEYTRDFVILTLLICQCTATIIFLIFSYAGSTLYSDLTT